MVRERSQNHPVSIDAQVTIPDTVLFHDLGGEAVLLNLTTGTYFGLDPIGTRMWHLLTERRSLKAICETVLEEYGVDRQQLARDLLRFVQALTAQGLLEHA